MGFLEIVTAVLTGGGSTIIGALVSKFFHWLEQKEETKRREKEQEHILASKRVDLEIAKQEGDNAVRVAEAEAAGIKDKADAEALGKSYDLEPPSFSATAGAPKKGKLHSFGWFLLVLLDLVRGSIRPGATIYLLYAVVSLEATAAAILMRIDPTIYEKEMAALFVQIVMSLLRMFEFSLGWYFGTRPGKTK